jgi:hypothetical protein
MGLSWVENYLYGNRCALCAEDKKKISLLSLLGLVFLDWMIYNAIVRLSKHEDAKMILIGSLGEAGYFDLNQIRSVAEKARFLRIFKRCAKRMK